MMFWVVVECCYGFLVGFQERCYVVVMMLWGVAMWLLEHCGWLLESCYAAAMGSHWFPGHCKSGCQSVAMWLLWSSR